MNKELSELKELIAEREKAEKDFEQSMAKLDARISALVAKLHSKTQAEPGPVSVTEHTRGAPRKIRSDKGKPRNPIAQGPGSDPDVSGGHSGGKVVCLDGMSVEDDPDEPIGEVVGHLG